MEVALIEATTRNWKILTVRGEGLPCPAVPVFDDEDILHKTTELDRGADEALEESY